MTGPYTTLLEAEALEATGRRNGPRSWLHCPWQPHVPAVQVNTVAFTGMWFPEAHKRNLYCSQEPPTFLQAARPLWAVGSLKGQRNPVQKMAKPPPPDQWPKGNTAFHLSLSPSLTPWPQASVPQLQWPPNEDVIFVLASLPSNPA